MNRFALATLLLTTACAAEEVTTDRPPFGENERLSSSAEGGGKADGSTAVAARARTSGYRSDDNTNCYDTWFDTEVTYENKSLPWGVKVELVSAMQGVEWWPDDVNNTYHYEYFDWKYEETKVAPAVGAWKWGAARGQWNYVGGGSFSKLHFAFKITYPDGKVRWDNGGSNWGYYELTPPPAPCDPSWTPWVSTTPTTWTDVTAHVVKKW